MADFSKECGIMGDGDFSIKEEFDKLQPSYLLPIICEGFGFLALGKAEDGVTCIVAMPTGEAATEDGHPVEWKVFDLETNTVTDKVYTGQ